MDGRLGDQGSSASTRVTALAAMYCAVVAAADALLSPAVLVGALIVAPLAVAPAGMPRASGSVGLLAVSICAAAFVWNDSWGEWSYWVPLVVNLIGATAGVFIALLRRRDLRDVRWSTALAAFGQALQHDAPSSMAQGAVLDSIVPGLADVAVLDLVGGDGVVMRAATRHPHEPTQAALCEAGADPHAGSRPTSVTRGPASALATLGDGVRITACLPLRVRGARVGELTLGALDDRSALIGRCLEDLQVLADRLAVAIDAEARDEESRRAGALQTAMLTQVSAAIMVRGVDGRLLYANRAAAELLRADDVDDLMAASSAELLERFEALDEDGRELGLEALPGTRVLRGEDDVAPIIVRNIVRATGEQRWLLNGATPLRDPASGELIGAVNAIEDVTQAKRGEHAQRLLAGALLALAATDDLDEGLRAVADLAVPNFADWAGIDRVDARGRLRAVAIAHRDPDKVALGLALRAEYPSRPDAPGSIAAVAAGGESLLIPHVTEELLVETAQDDRHLELLRGIGLNSTLAVPITASGTVLGVMSFVSSSSRRFDEHDRALALDLGRQVGVAIRAAQLSAERAVIAHTLQAGLSPEELPAIDGVALTAHYAPAGLANEIGGDFYDAVDCGDGMWVLVLGDVAGKGAAAASITAQARYTLRAALELTSDPVLALDVLNRRLVVSPAPRLCSVVLVLLSTSTDRVTVWRAGHPAPLHRAATGVVEVGVTGPLLGVDEDARWTPAECRLAVGDELLLYTDGATDGVIGDTRFGDTALKGLFGAHAGPPGERLAAVATGITEACDRLPDDIAMLHVCRQSVLVPAGG